MPSNISATTTTTSTTTKELSVKEQLELALSHKKHSRFEAAYKIYTDLASQQIPEAQYYLGLMLYEGLGIERDYRRAFDLFLEASKNKYSAANTQLGKMYFHGDHLTQHYENALIFLKAGQDSTAFEILGFMHVNGLGTSCDIEEAINYYKQAANLNNASACNDLAVIYQNQGKYEEALQYFQKAADLGSPSGLCNLGQYYEEGRLVEQDIFLAMDLYERAGELGAKNAWECLNRIRANPEEDEQLNHYYASFNLLREHASMEWGNRYNAFLRAASGEENPIAIYEVGMMNLEGRGTEKNIIAGLAYLEKAAQLGNQRAQSQLDKIHQEGYGMLSALSIFHCYFDAAKEKQSWAFYRLGTMQIELWCKAQDSNTGLSFPEQAARFGDEIIQDQLVNIVGHGKLSTEKITVKDLIFGFAFLEQAARFGDKVTRDQLKKMHRNGYGKLSPEIIVACYKVAAQQNLDGNTLNKAWALYRLGMMYLEDGNLDAALFCLEEAGLLEDHRALGQLNKMHQPEYVAFFRSEVLEAYKRAAIEEKTWALYRLGMTYIYSPLDANNYLEGVDYIERAADLGHVKAIEQLQQKSTEADSLQSRNYDNAGTISYSINHDKLDSKRIVELNSHTTPSPEDVNGSFSIDTLFDQISFDGQIQLTGHDKNKN